VRRVDFYEGYSPGDKSTTTEPNSIKISEITVWHQTLMPKKFWDPDFSEFAFCWISKWSHSQNCKISKVYTQKFDRSGSVRCWHPHHYIFTIYGSADTSYRPDFLSALNFCDLAECKIPNVWNFAILQFVDLDPGEHAGAARRPRRLSGFIEGHSVIIFMEVVWLSRLCFQDFLKFCTAK